MIDLILEDHNQEDLRGEDTTRQGKEDFIKTLKSKEGETQIRITIMMIYLSLFKSFRDESHFTAYCKKRLNVFNFVLSSDVDTLSLTSTFLMKAGTILNTFPKLVTVII